MKTIMIFLIELFFLLLKPTFGLSQIKMGDHPFEIDANAILEIESKQQGVLLPRMSTQERDAAFQGTVPNSLLIFNTDKDHFEVFISSRQTWEPIQANFLHFKVNDQTVEADGQNNIDLSFLLDNTDQQQLELDGQILKLEAGGSVDLGSVLNPEQKLELNGAILSLEGGGSVDLSALFTSRKDNQMLHLNNTVLSLDRGGSVDLSTIISPTIIQKIDHFQLSGSVLELSLSDDEESVHQIDLSGLKNEDQSLSISQTTLSLSRGGSVDLLPILEYVEAQNIEFSTPSSQTLYLGITKGNELNIEANELLSFSKKDSSTLVISAKNSTFSTSENITSNASQQWDQDDFVFGSKQLDNDPNTTTDNKRFFFDKSKGAFRAGIAQSDQWDENNIGTYSTAFGRNSIASNFHSVAFGLSTESRAWYSTAMGIGTIAPSRAETVIGSYNTEYTPLGGTNRWDYQDRLFVVGNGEGNSTASRSDALVIYKDGSTSTSGIWSGPGFYTTSSKSEKIKLSKLTLGIEILEKLIPYQYELKRLPDQLQFGFLAEELEAIVPNLVYESQGVKSVNYLGLLPILVNVLIEQQQELERLKKLHLE